MVFLQQGVLLCIKKDKLVAFISKWMDLKTIMLSKINLHQFLKHQNISIFLSSFIIPTIKHSDGVTPPSPLK